jgi:ASC-1-like (ASCH) protein
MNNIIHLNDPWFELVKSGEKIYEGRRKTIKSDNINIYDILLVKHYTDNTKEPYYIQIIDKLYFDNFEQALNTLPINKVLPTVTTVKEGIEIYKKYVSLETQKKDGIIMFKIIMCKI